MKEIILTTRGQVALVSDHRFDYLNQFKWYTSVQRNAFYACRSVWDVVTKKSYQLPMHRVIMNAPKGILVDHINRNSLDNQDENLRLASNRQNLMNRNIPPNNTSGVIGVYWSKMYKVWIANICIYNKTINLGRSHDKEEAIKLRKDAELKYFGEYAPIENK